jgi:radical SAM protein with 4Fe4S-binding SPASM domain
MNRVLLPPRTRVWADKDWYLYFDPYNFAWVRVNESGRFVLERLRRYRTQEQIAQEIAEAFGMEPEAARISLDTFVNRLMEAGFLHLNEYRERERAVFHQREFAHDVYLHLTNNCNLKCPYCYNKSDREYKLELERKGRFAPILTTQEYKCLIARLLALGAKHLLFTGGEPLMRPDALDLIEFARSQSQDVRLELLTNAILIKGDVAERLCESIDMVTISLDGHERHLHEHYRGNNTFTPTIRGVRELVETRRRRKQAKPYVGIVPALTDKNIGFMKEIFEFSLDELGADMLAPILFQPGDHQELSLQQIPCLEEWTAAQAQTNEYLALRAKRLGTENRSRPPRPVPARNHCGVGHGEFSIDPSGYVYPCQSLHFDEFVCGNVRTEDVKAIFDNSPVMNRVRGTVVDRLTVCRHCDLKHLCNGGCRATAYNIYRDFEAHNEIYCRHLEKIALDRLWSNSNMPLYSNESACV